MRTGRGRARLARRASCRRAGSAPVLVLVVVLAVAGCGGSSQSNRPPLLKLSRPRAPVWCPLTTTVPPGSFDARTVLGMPESDAAMSLARHGCRSRVVVVDGHPRTITSDFVPNRIDLTIDHDVVTAIGRG